jgi:hypothetical protein
MRPPSYSKSLLLDPALTAIDRETRAGFHRFMSQQWPTTSDVYTMVRWAEKHAPGLSERKLRLFAVACCRRVWHLLSEAASCQLVETCELYADGQASADEMYEVRRRTSPLECYHPRTPYSLAREAARAAVEGSELSFSSLAKSALAILPALYAAKAAGLLHPGGEEAEWQAQADLLRDIVGNPLQPVQLDLSWLWWNDGIVRQLAEEAYEQRHLPSGQLDHARLAVLADALEEAGCQEWNILDHLRQPGAVHARGCFAVDLLLSRS